MGEVWSSVTVNPAASWPEQDTASSLQMEGTKKLKFP